MIQVPVTIEFDDTKRIGTLEIDETRLPEIPSFHFALKGEVLEKQDGVITKFRLLGISLLPDSKFEPLCPPAKPKDLA